MSLQKVIDIPRLLTEDVRALHSLLSLSKPREREFHQLLEEHPAILGVLGYSKFLSEQPVPKRDAFGSIAKFKDRPDILAARKSDFASTILRTPF
jgi:hypothetical protein